MLSGRPSGPVRREITELGFDLRLASSLSIGRRDLAPKHPIGVAQAGETGSRTTRPAPTNFSADRSAASVQMVA